MRWIFIGLILIFFIFNIPLNSSIYCAEKKEGYLLPGNVKEGWKVFNTKKCVLCHSIFGEGGKGGPDLGGLPESYVSQSHLVALLWNHGPEMWTKMTSKKIPFQKINTKEMADLFAFLYFIRYMDEPGDLKKGKALMESNCIQCHSIKEGAKGDLGRWAAYVNPILWAQIMWNHTSQMGKEMKEKGISRIEFKGNEMVDLIAYIRSSSPATERMYLSPGDPVSGEKLFSKKECLKCHFPDGKLDLFKRKGFPKTLGQLAGILWNHSYEMWMEMEKRGIERPLLSPQEMADIVAYLFSNRYFDEPGDPTRGKTIFLRKNCTFCHTKDKKPDLSVLKGRLSPILMAQRMWNHGPEMLEKMKKSKVVWQKIKGEEMIDLMEYINQGMP